MPAAFPGAYGWGAGSVGGRGGTVIPVTNLNDTGDGSLRQVLENPGGPRIIVFRVGGVINLTAGLIISSPYITIAGQTAPGSGITIRGGGLLFNTHNVIVRYLRHRGTGVGDVGFILLRPDNDCHDVIIDHCSGSWNHDDLFDGWHNVVAAPAIYNITVQNCLFSEPLAEHPTSLLFGTQVPVMGIPPEKFHHISIHNNLFSNVGHRNPLIGTKHTQIVNNLVYNWDYFISGFNFGAEVDFINNYWKPGPNDGVLRITRDDPDASVNSIYIAGNILPGELEDPIADNWTSKMVRDNDGPLTPTVAAIHRRLTPLAVSSDPLSVVSASVAYNNILADVGANRRLAGDGTWVSNPDSYDAAMIADAKNNTGISVLPSSPGAVPTQDAGTAYTDTDGDGMPDEWELAHGLNPNDPNDGPVIGPSGYTNLELFLNGENAPVLPPAELAKNLWVRSPVQISVRTR